MRGWSWRISRPRPASTWPFRRPSEEVGSIGGLVTWLLGRVPQRGEIVAHPAGYEFEVLEADPRRVKRLRIRRAETLSGRHDGKAWTDWVSRIRGLTGWRRLLLRFPGRARFRRWALRRSNSFRRCFWALRCWCCCWTARTRARIPSARRRWRAGLSLSGNISWVWHWIGYAFMVDPSAHLWQMPFALVSLTAGLALYAGIASALAICVLAGRPGAASGLRRIFYAVGEWVRGHALTGFPWNLAGLWLGRVLGGAAKRRPDRRLWAFLSHHSVSGRRWRNFWPRRAGWLAPSR